METNRTVLTIAALKAIADHILTIPNEEWDMAIYKKENKCGTVGCALGHSIGLPEVQALFEPERLWLKPNNYSGDPDTQTYSLVVGNQEYSSIALTRYFDIDKTEFWKMFGISNRGLNQKQINPSNCRKTL